MLEPWHLTNGDNLRLVPADRLPQAIAAVQFMEMIEADAAVERVAGKQKYEGVPLRSRDEW